MDTPATPPASPQSRAVNIGGQANVTTGGDIVGGNKIVGYTAEQVRVLIAQISSTFQKKPFDGRSPYVGLASFQEQDADRFFGREKLTQELVARIETARFVVIAGPSGSGKSSVARAGLLHELREGALDGSENWLYEILTPGRHPLEQLARVVSSFAKSTKAGDEIQQRGRDDATLLHRLADIALGDQRTRRAILLVDQFEEVFTQVTDETEYAAFLNLLVYAATVENGRVTIVVCTRSDFIGNWAAYPNLNAQLRQGVNQIPPMQPDELVSAIARPALQVGLQIDPELVKQILDDMRDAPGALPLMQFALDDLFEYEKSKGGVIALTRDDYLERGGLQKALSRHADAEFAKLNADEQQIARSVFAGLIEPGRGSVDTKRTALFSELVSSGTDAAQVKTVVTKLADARLITTDEQEGRETVTLAHERLIDAWAWLRRLVDENREAIALQNQIAEDAQEWIQHGRDASYLYTGARLATAQEQVACKKIVLSELAQEFVEASIVAREEERKKETQRTRRLIIAFGAAAVAFAVLAVVAFLAQQNAIRSESKAQAESTRAIEQQQTAEAERDKAEQSEADALSAAILADNAKATAVAEAAISRSRELAITALSQLDLNPERALLIAIAANKVKVTFESDEVLRRILDKLGVSPISNRLSTQRRGFIDGIDIANFSPDLHLLLTIDTDRTNEGYRIVNVWEDSYNGWFIHKATLHGHVDQITDAEFSQNGKSVVTSSLDTTSRVWDLTFDMETIISKSKEFIGRAGRVNSSQFSPDGSRVVTANSDNTVRIWDTKSGSLINVLRGHDRAVLRAMFSPDASKIVTISSDQTVRIWDVESSTAILVIRRQNGYFLDVEFSPDSKEIVTANSDMTANVWDTATGKELVVLHGHEGTVTSAKFSPNGRLIVTTGEDKTVRIWDVATGKELRLLRSNDGAIVSTQFSPDSKRIATIDSDGTIKLFLTEIEDLIAVAKTRVKHELTCQERVQYLREEIVCPTP